LARYLAVDASFWLLDEPLLVESYDANQPLLNFPGTWHPASIKRLLAHPHSGLPGSEDPEGGRYLLLRSDGRILGILRLNAENEGYDLNRDQEEFLEDFIEQIAHHIDRLKLSLEAQESNFQMEAESLRNALLSAISHDLKTPLTRIMGAATVISDQGNTLSKAALDDFSGTLKAEVEHMAALMNKILDMARLTAGDIVPHPEWNHLEEIVGACLQRLEPALANRPIEIEIDPELPLVKIDALLIQQVIINLIENAVKYTPEQTPIEIIGETIDDRVCLSVRDYGPGIPDQAIERIFRKFSRLDPEGTQTGVGLGLSLSRSIIELHGGELFYEHNPMGGACFTMSLPEAGIIQMPSEEPSE
jgi:two-component system sensor histidine kinase KdpD